MYIYKNIWVSFSFQDASAIKYTKYFHKPVLRSSCNISTMAIHL